MAQLTHSINTIEDGSLGWRLILNSNLQKLDINRFFVIELDADFPNSNFKEGRFIVSKESGIIKYDNGIELINIGINLEEIDSGTFLDPLKTLQQLRGLEVDRLNITPLSGQLLYTTDENKLYIGDGSTVGGILLNETFGDGDMSKTTYDSNDSGIIDNSELLEGNDSAYHLDRTNHTGTQTLSTISDAGTAASKDIGVNSGNIPVLDSNGKLEVDIIPSFIVNDSEALEGNDSAYHLDRTNHTGTQTLSTISDAGTAASKDIGVNSGNIPVLDNNGKLNISTLPSLAITSVFLATSEIEQLLINAQEGDIIIRSDLSLTYVNNGGVSGTMSDYNQLVSPTDSVTSVNGQIGVVSLDSDDVLEGITNKYYTDSLVQTYITNNIIDDLTISLSKVYSSSKIDADFDKKTDPINGGTF